ncbi:ATP-binding protein [bacterium SCSIO 12741]|nr:ATP-binding protein [bacterium SCSIO 12741]
MATEGLIAESNAETLEHEIRWLEEVLDVRFKLYFGHECDYEHILKLQPPNLEHDPSEYAQFCHSLSLSFAERILVLLALLPHIRPQLLDIFFIKNKNYDRGYTEFGGIQGSTHGGFLPTVETAAFILAGDNLPERIHLASMLQPHSNLIREEVLLPVSKSYKESVFSSRLQVAPDFFNRLFQAGNAEPEFSPEFPARRIKTDLDWEDVVMSPALIHEIFEVKDWIEHGGEVLDQWNLEKWVKPGYRALFYGPSGTGKTMTACLLGKSVNRKVFRVDLSQVISKYIGETEENLARLFDRAENKNWILFFDEADALFGKRGQTKSSNDRYANQEVAYLLQRIEDYNGLIILASNLKSNMDSAFSRRFQSMIYFPLPNSSERFQLLSSLVEGRFGDRKFLKNLTHQYELSGGALVNVARYAALQAVRKGAQVYDPEDLREGVRKEMQKSGKTGV